MEEAGVSSPSDWMGIEPWPTLPRRPGSPYLCHPHALTSLPARIMEEEKKAPRLEAGRWVNLEEKWGVQIEFFNTPHRVKRKYRVKRKSNLLAYLRIAVPGPGGWWTSSSDGITSLPMPCIYCAYSVLDLACCLGYPDGSLVVIPPETTPAFFKLLEASAALRQS